MAISVSIKEAMSSCHNPSVADLDWKKKVNFRKSSRESENLQIRRRILKFAKPKENFEICKTKGEFGNLQNQRRIWKFAKPKENLEIWKSGGGLENLEIWRRIWKSRGDEITLRNTNHGDHI